MAKFSLWTDAEVAKYLEALEQATSRSPSNIMNRLLDQYLSKVPATPAPKVIQDYVAACWSGLESLPAHKALFADSNFQRAWEIFEQRRKRQANKCHKDPLAQFLFLQSVAEDIQFYRLIQARSKPLFADSKVRSTAKTAVKHLLSLMAKGVSLPVYKENQQLEDNLNKLYHVLSTTPRKAYVGKNWREKYFVRSLALDLKRRLDLKSVAILGHAAAIIGYTPDKSTLQRELEGV